jgi:hypothetical protein
VNFWEEHTGKSELVLVELDKIKYTEGKGEIQVVSRFNEVLSRPFPVNKLKLKLANGETKFLVSTSDIKFNNYEPDALLTVGRPEKYEMYDPSNPAHCNQMIKLN